MDETKKTEGTSEKDTAPPETSQNQVFEKMMSSGRMDSFLKGLSSHEQEEWKSFVSSTLVNYDKLICMIKEVTSTEKGKEQFYSELMKEAAKKLDFEDAANLRDRIKQLRQKMAGKV